MNVVEFLLETIQRHIVRILSVVVLIALVDISQSVPPNYCLLPPNITDCKGPPTPVFYYYKPGSRCEIAIWRGCPTQNIFPDEVLCVHTCIFRFIAQADSWENQVMENKTDWETRLNQITEDEADDVILILDEVLEPKPKPPKRTKPKRTKLKHYIASVNTTNNATSSVLISEIDSSAIEDTSITGTTSEKTTLAETTPTIMTDSTIEDATTTDFTKEETTVSATTASTTTPFTTLAASTTPSSTKTTDATTLSVGEAQEIILP